MESLARGRAGLRARLAGASAEMQLVVAILVVAGVFSVLLSEFATASNLQSMARQAGVLLIVASGQTFALLVGGFDLSVGANMGFSSVVGAQVMLDHGLAAGLLAGLAAGLAVGLVNGVLIARVRISPFIATLSMLTFLTGLTNQLADGSSIYGLPSSFANLGARDFGPIPSTIALAALVLVGAHLLLTRTRPGLYLYAIGGGREAAELAGIRVVRHEIVAYVICGGLAGLAGLVLASRVSVAQASLGQGYELLSIATAVMGGVAIGGGTGRVGGVVLGVALLSVLTTGLNLAGASDYLQQMFTGVIVVVAVGMGRLRDLGGSAIGRARRLLVRPPIRRSAPNNEGVTP